MSRILGVLEGDGVGPALTGASCSLLTELATRGLIEPIITHIFPLLPIDQRAGRVVSAAKLRSWSAGLDGILIGPIDAAAAGNSFARSLVFGLRRELGHLGEVRLFYTSSVAMEYGAVLHGAVLRPTFGGLYRPPDSRPWDGNAMAPERARDTEAGVLSFYRAAERFLSSRAGDLPVFVAHKSNAMPALGGIWRRAWEQFAEESKGAQNWTFAHVDTLAERLAADGLDRFAILSEMLMADILSSVAAARFLGSAGVPSLLLPDSGNQPVVAGVAHGTAADLPDPGQADALGILLAACELLSGWGYADLAARLRTAILILARDPAPGSNLTPATLQAHLALLLDSL